MVLEKIGCPLHKMNQGPSPILYTKINYKAIKLDENRGKASGSWILKCFIRHDIKRTGNKSQNRRDYIKVKTSVHQRKQQSGKATNLQNQKITATQIYNKKLILRLFKEFQQQNKQLDF